MKKIWILIFCLLTRQGMAQKVIADPNVKNVFNKVMQQLPGEYRQGAKNLISGTKGMGGLAIYTAYHIDTLNKSDLIHTNITVSVTDVGSSQAKTHQPTDENTNLPIPCMAALKGDTLIIALPPAFSPYILHKVIHHQLTSNYREYQKGDTIFRLNPSRSKTDGLDIPVKTPVFKLSTLNFKPGKSIYGEIDYLTDPYDVDDPSFKSGYINRRIHAKYVFEAIVFDFAKPPLY